VQWETVTGLNGVTVSRETVVRTHPETPVLLYFAYGSNMSTPRLVSRVASAHAIAAACLPAHTLRFHKQGRDGSAKCDACHTGLASDAVHGVVFRIAAGEKALLDEQEGLGNGYGEKTVIVTGAHGKSYRAFTYYATCIDPCLRPFHWYLEHVIRGAIEHRLRDEYIAAIRAIASVGDPVPGRHDCELAIYSAGLPPGTTALHCGHGNKAFDGRPPAGMPGITRHEAGSK